MKNFLLTITTLLMLVCSAHAQVVTLGNPINPATTGAAVTGLVAKSSQGVLTGFSGVAGASAGWFMVFNSASLIANGAVTPVACYPVAANQMIAVSYLPATIALNAGATIMFSTTGCFTETQSATAFISAQVQ